ncbi:MAG: hypothetical protein NWR72_03665 [Bacteroidia bacterium]|nr:hypothetical protein [Bacteroidia bacterium]
MDPLLTFLDVLILLQGTFLIIGIVNVKQTSRQIPAIVAAGLLISAMIVAMFFQRWDVLILSFVIHRSWTMLESLLLQGRVSSSTWALAPVNLISISGALVSFFSGLWIVFGLTYLFHWAMTLFVGKRIMTRLSS